MIQSEAVRQLHQLCAELPGWEPAPALAPEATYHHASAQAWVRVTTRNRLAVSGGALDYPRTTDLDELDELPGPASWGVHDTPSS